MEEQKSTKLTDEERYALKANLIQFTKWAMANADIVPQEVLRILPAVCQILLHDFTQ